MARGLPDEDEELDAVEEAGEASDDDELDGFQDVDAEEIDFDDDEDLETDDLDEDIDTDLEVSGLPDGDLGDDATETATVVALLEDEAEIVAAVEDDDEDEDVLREGEFVCRSCFMAKRESALADPDAMLCRDCA